MHSEIAREIAAFMRQHTERFCDWYVGDTSSVSHLLDSRRLNPEGLWIARDLGDAAQAEDVEVYFQALGCDGVSFGESRSSTIVYAFLKPTNH